MKYIPRNLLKVHKMNLDSSSSHSGDCFFYFVISSILIIFQAAKSSYSIEMSILIVYNWFFIFKTSQNPFQRSEEGNFQNKRQKYYVGRTFIARVGGKLSTIGILDSEFCEKILDFYENSKSQNTRLL